MPVGSGGVLPNPAGGLGGLGEGVMLMTPPPASGGVLPKPAGGDGGDGDGVILMPAGSCGGGGVLPKPAGGLGVDAALCSPAVAARNCCCSCCRVQLPNMNCCG